MSDLPPRIDMLIPPEMAAKAEDAGVKKASMGWLNMLLLAILAGAFISLGAIFSTTVTTCAAQQLPYGVVRLLGGLVFCLGLILVIVGGAELFTGNNLITVLTTDMGLLSNHNGLYHTLCRNGVGQLLQGFLIKMLTRLPRTTLNQINIYIA